MPNPTWIPTRDAITQLLFIRDEARPVDLAVVLGSKYATTMDPAIELCAKGWAPTILITGHGPEVEQEKECELFREYAIGRGVDPADILVEPNARNTLENMTLSLPIVEKAIGWAQIRTVSLTCKPFHARRALMTARKQWPAHVGLVMLPSRDPRDMQPETWWNSEDSRRRVLDEVRRIGEYAVKGDLGDF